MLSPEEKQYLTWLTTEKFEGWGAVVDLGPWLGSSSAALAEGLKRSGAEKKVCSFDLFQWEPSYMEAVAPLGLGQGEDFLPVFLQETGEYACWIDARKQDLLSYCWDEGPIEILFVDAAKSWELTNAIFRNFGPFLEAGRSRVVLQDFRYHETHWLPLIFDSRPDLWQETEDVDEGHTVTFIPLKQLRSPSGIQTDYSEESFPLKATERLLRDRIEREEPTKRHWFLRMLYRKYVLDGPSEEAQRLRQELLANGLGAADLAAIEDLECFLVPRGWRAYDAGKFEEAATSAQRSLSLSKKRSVDALTLLGFSVFRMGDKEAASRAMDEVLFLDPHHSAARLFRAEMAIVEGRFHEAEEETLDIIKRSAGDEDTINYALNVLSRIWSLDRREELQLKVLHTVADRLQASPSFLSCLSHEQAKAGLFREARRNIERALALTPGEELATKLRAEWHALQTTDENVFSDSAAGRLHKPHIPKRSSSLAGVSLDQLTSEVIARAGQGSFEASEEAILLGLEMDRTLRRSLDVHNNRFSRRRYRDLFECFFQYVGPPSPQITDATIMDLGCGSLNPYGLLFLFLMLGAGRGIAVDLDAIYDRSSSARALADLAAELLVSPGEIVGAYPITREQILRNIATFNLAKLRGGDYMGIDPSRLIHRRDSVHSLSLDDGEVDLIFSNAFFEHIPEVDTAIAELARVTRPGGVGVHVIDCSDHRRYQDNKIHPLQFLTEPHTDPLPHGSNRLRLADFAAIFERHGFEVVQTHPFERAEVDEELRNRLVESFPSMADDSLAVIVAKLVVRRTSR
jgi:SAM-dependent methyltransferase/Flp pilus assembly protein TadD